MLLKHKPVPGYWYSNIVGQLVQVRALRFSRSRIELVALEYASGKRDFVDLDGWYYLDLSLHSPRLERRDQVRDL